MGFLSDALLRLELFELDRPTSLEQCYSPGTTRICPTKLAAYNSYLFDEAVVLTNRHRDDDDHQYDLAGVSLSEPKQKKSRSRRKSIMEYYDDNGERQPLLPTDTTWYKCYVKVPVRTKEFEALFRSRFRLPYDSFLELVKDAKDGKWFPRWDNNLLKGTNKSSPLELLLLGSLRYLGRGWTFDDLEEVTAISRRVHNSFFHDFIGIGSTILYQKYVVAPTNKEEAARHLQAYLIGGFPGCMGSTDATHILVGKCYFGLRQNHLGAKFKSTARTYNLTVNHG
jgi:hypothetical protein